MHWSQVGARLLVRDFHAVFDFYREKIGLEINWGNRDGDYVAFSAPGATSPCLAIFKRERMPRYQGYVHPESTAASDHVILIIPTDDVDKDYAELRAHGVVFMGEPQTIPEWYMRCVYFRDPEGNLLELCQAGEYAEED